MHSASQPRSSINILSAAHKNSLPQIKEAIKDTITKKDKDGRRTKPAPRENREYTGIPRNINYYRHLINDHDSTQDGVDWVLKLRSTRASNSVQKTEPTSAQPFSFTDKALEGQAHRRQITDLDARNSLHQLTHLLYHRMGPSPTRGSLQFESGLRSYGSISNDLMGKEKGWRNIPKKDKKGDVTMYPSYEEMGHIKNWTAKNTTIKMHAAYDGHLSFPKYDELCKSADKNLAETGHLLTAPGQHMPLVNWQLSMRNYGNPLRRAVSVDKTNTSVNSVGEAKKIKRPQRV